MHFFAHLNHNLLNVCWKWKRNVLSVNTKAVRNGLAVRIFPANPRTYTKDTALSEHGKGTAPCV
jgi:hypothetical protein